MAYDSSLSRLPDPTTVPAGPGFLSQALIDNSPGTIHPLNNGGTVSVKFAGNYWGISITYPQLTLEEGSTLIPFLYSLNGAFNNFYVQLPTHVFPKSGPWTEVTNTEIALGDISIGSTANSIVIPDWLARGGNIQAGDMLKFTNSHKIYMVVAENLNVDTKTIFLNCDILEPDKVATAGLEMNDIRFRVRQKGDTPQIQLNPDGLYEGISLNLRENIL